MTSREYQDLGRRFNDLLSVVAQFEVKLSALADKVDRLTSISTATQMEIADNRQKISSDLSKISTDLRLFFKWFKEKMGLSDEDYRKGFVEVYDSVYAVCHDGSISGAVKVEFYKFPQSPEAIEGETQDIKPS